MKESQGLPLGFPTSLYVCPQLHEFVFDSGDVGNILLQLSTEGCHKSPNVPLSTCVLPRLGHLKADLSPSDQIAILQSPSIGKNLFHSLIPLYHSLWNAKLL